MEPGGEERKLAHLDGLRGLAAVVVVFHHFACAFLPAAVFGGAVAAHFSLERTIYNTPLQLMVAGNFAVCIFFVLSGYVLSHKFFITKDSAHARSGAAKRYFRLMPPILASILISYAIFRLGAPHHLQAAAISGSSLWLAHLWPQAVGLKEALLQGTYSILVGRADTTIFNNVLWTMKIEFFGSFLVFGFLALFGTARNRWVAYLAAVLLFWNGYYLAFIIGMALCDLAANRPKVRQLSLFTLIASGLTGLLLGAAPIIGSTRTIYSQLEVPFLPAADLFILPHVIGAGLVLMTVLYSRRLKLGLSTRPMRYLGKISFSMYLVHVLIIGSLSSALLTWVAPHHSYFNALLITILISIPMILVASHFFTRFVDGPSVRLANKLSSKWFATKSPNKHLSDRIAS